MFSFAKIVAGPQLAEPITGTEIKGDKIFEFVLIREITFFFLS